MADAHKQAEEVVTKYQEELKTVRENDRLSVEGKQIQIAVIYHKAQQSLTEILEARDEGVMREREKLERKLFGPSFVMTATNTEKIIARQAYVNYLDRVNRIESSNEADEMLDRARMAGDELLTRAVLAATWQRMPDTAERAVSMLGLQEEAQALQQLNSPVLDDVVADFIFAGVDLPAELSSLGDSSIAELASQAG